MAVDAKELHKRFNLHSANEITGQVMDSLRASHRKLAADVATLTHESREQSLALTHLEEALFWANAAIARNYTERGVPMACERVIEVPEGKQLMCNPDKKCITFLIDKPKLG